MVVELDRKFGGLHVLERIGKVEAVRPKNEPMLAKAICSRP